jgi:chemotaxis protein MotB
MGLKRRSASTPHRDRWLVSYADFITLLFAFFVLMFASAQVDKEKVSRLATAIQSAFLDLGVLPAPSSKTPRNMAAVVPGSSPPVAGAFDANSPGNLAELHKELADVLAGEIKRGDVALIATREGLVISLREIGFFGSGSAAIKLKSEPSVARIAKVLETHSCNVRIEGHTDDVPIHTGRFASNWELSTTRATEVAKLFITRYGFPPGRLSAAGFAEFHPVASNETPEGRALNRRVDIVVAASPAAVLSQFTQGEAGKPPGSTILP